MRTRSQGVTGQQFQNTTDLQASQLSSNTIAQLITGERYSIDDVDGGSGLLLASGNFANELGASAEIVNPLTVSGEAIAGGVINQIRDSGAFTMPLANSVAINAILVIELPDRYKADTPTLDVSGADVFVNGDGTDTQIQWAGAERITLTSNGVDEWSL